MSRYLHDLIKPLVGKTEYAVKNSKEFVQSIKTKQLKPGEVMVSYDAVSLFTNVPIKETTEYIRELLNMDATLQNRTKLSVDDIVEGVNLCLTCTYFKWRDNFYEQIDGVAMGCPLSTIAADIFMEKMESIHVKHNNNIKFYKRFVDDIFVIIRGRQIKNFLDKLNSFHPNVQFTFETEQDYALPFLDVFIMKQCDGSLKFKIYRKKTHTDKYLDWNSVHPRAHKITVVNTLIQRALNICSEEYLQEEIKYVEEVLIYKNNYPRFWVQKQIKRVIDSFGKPKIDIEDQPRVILPYVPGLTESTARIISRKLGNPLGYIPFQRMSEVLSTYKDKSICRKCGVYSIECSCGHIYIGQTGRDLKDRVAEHKRSTNTGDIIRSAVSEHVWTNLNEDHDIQWNNAHLIDEESRFFQRHVKESIHIQKAQRDGKPLMNRKNECPTQKLPVCYTTILDTLFST